MKNVDNSFKDMSSRYESGLRRSNYFPSNTCDTVSAYLRKGLETNIQLTI
jgi:hypothetical protein